MRFGVLSTALAVAILSSGSVVAQTPVAPPGVGKPKPPVVTPDANDPKSAVDSSKPEQKMTKQQTKELFRSVDEIMAFASKDSHLPVKHSVKRQMISRETVNRFLLKRFEEDKSAQRMERSELVLKKFGLLEHDFNLKPFLVSLLTEQIAGYYDVKTKTVNMLDWMKPEEQKPVLAHELTHALQDQRVDMTKWSSPLEETVSSDARDDNRHIQNDEASTARDAVAEGQAMLVFVDYAIKDTGKTVADAPEIGEKMREAASDPSGSPLLARAPLVLQESLLFPYASGIAFEQALLQKGGVDVAYAGALDRPPGSSHEILHPEDYMVHAPVPVLAMPDIHPLVDRDWEPYDVGVMGELDVRMTAELFGGAEMGQAISQAWDGGIYYAAQRRAATVAEKATTKSIGLVYYSRWKNDASARGFMRVYAAELPRKYSGLKQVEGDGPDAEVQRFTTNEGDVVLSLKGRELFISEGFDTATAARVEERMRVAQGSGPVLNAGVPMRELGLRLAQGMGSFGVMKAGLAR